MAKFETLLNNWKTILTSLVALLVIVPSVLNAVNDIWVAWQHLPIGEKEKINNTLFKKHWKENPLLSKQLIIEGKKGRIPVTIEIYTDGDIFVDYGLFTQWFPYAIAKMASHKFEIITSAYAGFFSKVDQNIKAVNAKPTQINNSREKNNVIREKVLSDGSIERQTININTGEVIKAERIPPQVTPPTAMTPGDIRMETIEVIKLPTSNNEKVKTYTISPNTQ